MYELADTLTVTSINAPTGTRTRHDLTVLEAAPVPDSNGKVAVIGLDSIDQRLYVVTVDDQEDLCQITWAESLKEALALLAEQCEQD